MRLILFLITPVFLFSQELSFISGKFEDLIVVVLRVVNIMLNGTYYGTASGPNGQYKINKIQPGNYDLELSMIGYKIILKTGIKVKAERGLVLNFVMEETVLSFGEDVVVLGRNPLFDVDETSSMTRVRQVEIANNIVSSVEDILSEQIGVTTQDNEIHIRGGRIDESLFMVDGFSVKDPLTGYSGNLFVNADAIEELEIITGGYNAEYGQAMSGIVNIKLKEGKQSYEGAFKFASDRVFACLLYTSPSPRDRG